MPDDDLPGIDIGNPAWFVAGAIDDGLSRNASLAAFREAGGQFGNEAWRRLYDEVSDSLARGSVAAGLDPYALPDPNDYATWTMGRGGEYVTQVKAFFRDRDSGLSGSKGYLYKTDEPHTPAEAIQAMMDEYGDPDNENEYGQSLQGGIVSNIYVTEPFGG